ncbi:MAG: DUF4328 domain-containing protein [Gaiellaceae bacterium]
MDVIRTRATWTKRLLLAPLAVAVVAAVTDVQEYRSPLRESDFYGEVGFVQLLLVITVGIAFISWLYAAYQALPSTGSTRRFKAWWAIVSWFIPILNLIRPKQIADEVWKAGHRPALAVPGYVQVWWAGWVTSLLLGNIAGRLYASADTAGDIQTAAAIYLVSDVADIATAALAYRFVEDATSGLERSAAD